MTTPAETVQKFVSLLQGEILKVGPGKDVKLDGGEVTITAKAANGDIHATFDGGKKPTASFKGLRGDIHGMVICQKGIRFDVELIPAVWDPFFTWDELKGL